MQPHCYLQASCAKLTAHPGNMLGAVPCHGRMSGSSDIQLGLPSMMLPVCQHNMNIGF